MNHVGLLTLHATDVCGWKTFTKKVKGNTLVSIFVCKKKKKYFEVMIL